MSWSLGASGHANAKEQEDAFVEKMKAAFADAEGVSSATIHTQYSGSVNLLDGAKVSSAGAPASGLEARKESESEVRNGS